MGVLVLGANGQLGTDVVAAGRRRPEVVTTGWTRADLDLADLDAIARAIAKQSPKVVVNCTGLHQVDEVEADGTRAVAVNAHAVNAMAHATAEIGARFVHFSTDYVFDGGSGRPYTESDCPAPINVYGATKYLGENLAGRANRDTLVLRVASLFGVAGSRGKGGNFVQTMLRLARERGELRVVDDIRMSPTSTVSVAEALFDLLDASAPGGVYHAVNTGSATWYEFAREIMHLAGLDVPVTPVSSAEFPSRAARPPFSALDNARIQRMMSRPMTTWQQALAAYMGRR